MMKGRCHSDETREKMSKSHKGKHRSEEHCKRLSESLKGRHHSEETCKKLSRITKCLWQDLEYRKKNRTNTGKPGAMKGKHHSLESIEKMRRANLGKIPWIKGKRHSEKTREKLRESHIGQIPWNKGRHHSEETRKKMREHWQDPEFVQRVMKGLRSKTTPERQLDILLQQLYPGEFEYNGHFELGVAIDGLVPDFVNINGRKKIIEMNGDHWHQNSVREEEKKARYAKCGFSCLTIWGGELKNNKKEVINKLTDFVEKEPSHYFDMNGRAEQL